MLGSPGRDCVPGIQCASGSQARQLTAGIPATLTGVSVYLLDLMILFLCFLQGKKKRRSREKHQESNTGETFPQQ